MREIPFLNFGIRLSVVVLHASDFIVYSVCCAGATTAKAGYAEQRNFFGLLLWSRLKRMVDEDD
jgi:hypothetical protein